EPYSTLDQLAKTPSFTSVFSNPNINTYVLTSYSISVPGGGDPAEYWLNGMTDAQKAAEQTSFYNTSAYLLTHYNGTGKTFIFENWDGDWALRDGNHSGLHDAIPNSTNIQGLRDWINARQAGINQARAQSAAG